MISSDQESQEFKSFIRLYTQIQKNNFEQIKIPYKHCENNIWIVKPVNLNQGRGIEIFNNLKDIKQYLQTKTQNSLHVIQKYIERPLLYNDRKFDIRVWVIVTENFEIYFYKQGYLRTCSSEYTTETQNTQVHLTNQCVQNKLDGFGKFEEGNTLSFQLFQKYLDNQGYNVSVQDHLIPRMKDIIIDTILSSKNQLNPNGIKNCFELFGYDFLIDEDFRIWLIEVNENPYLGTPNDFIKEVVPKMINDMLTLIIEPIYPLQFENVFNEYELIHDSLYSQRRSFNKKFLYPIEINDNNYNYKPAVVKQTLGEQQFQAQNTIEKFYNSLKNNIYNNSITNIEIFFQNIDRIFRFVKKYNNVNSNEQEHVIMSLNLIISSRLIDSFQDNRSSKFYKIHNPKLNQINNWQLIKQIKMLNHFTNTIYFYKIYQKNDNFFKNIFFLSINTQINAEIQKDIIFLSIKLFQFFFKNCEVPGFKRFIEQNQKIFVQQGGIFFLFIHSKAKQYQNEILQILKSITTTNLYQLYDLIGGKMDVLKKYDHKTIQLLGDVVINECIDFIDDLINKQEQAIKEKIEQNNLSDSEKTNGYKNQKDVLDQMNSKKFKEDSKKIRYMIDRSLHTNNADLLKESFFKNLSQTKHTSKIERNDKKLKNLKSYKTQKSIQFPQCIIKDKNFEIYKSQLEMQKEQQKSINKQRLVLNNIGFDKNKFQEIKKEKQPTLINQSNKKQLQKPNNYKIQTFYRKTNNITSSIEIDQLPPKNYFQEKLTQMFSRHVYQKNGVINNNKKYYNN